MPSRSITAVGLLTCVGLTVTACGSGTDASRATSPAPAAGATSTPSATRTPETTAPPTSPSSKATSRAASPSSTAQGASCVTKLAGHLTPAQRAGQLVMVGLDAHASRASVADLVTRDHLGGVVYLGGWQGASHVADTSAYLQDKVTAASTGRTGLIIAADQEGGQVQQLTGAGFTRVPSALAQGAENPTVLQRNAATMGRELKAAGVNTDLAPVADTVPVSIGRANQPIGRYDREYGHTPQAVARAVPAVVRGLHSAGVVATLKHFPGIGRITGNTDVTSTGITDSVMTSDDPYLQPFRAGIEAGSGMVMVGFGRYPKIDPTHEAAFSSSIIDGMLRDELKFDGVVISDDLNAAAVRHLPAGRRAVDFIRAGGDIALTGSTADAPRAVATIAAEAKDEKGFAQQVRHSVIRVLRLKTRMGLTSCSSDG